MRPIKRKINNKKIKNLVHYHDYDKEKMVLFQQVIIYR